MGSLTVTTNELSVSAWIRPTYAYTIGIMGKSYGEYAGWRLIYKSDNKIEISINSSSSTYYTLTNPQTTALNSYHHVLFTYNKTTGNLVLYVDGVSAILPGCTNGVFTYNSYILNFYIGCDYSSTPRFYGGIDDVRFYDRALTVNEVNNLYHEGEF